MEELGVQSITDFKNGLITPSAVSESQIPLTAVSEAVNVHFNKIGAATLRKGLTSLGTGLPSTILGLYEFRDSGAGTNNQIVAVSGTSLYYLNGGTWTVKRDSLTSGSPARFTTFLDYLWMVNGTEPTAVWNGDTTSSFSTGGNALSAPIGQYIENFRSRVWIAGNHTFPDRIYYSSLPSDVAVPLVTWDTNVTGGGWINISPSDGDNITGLKRSKNTLLVFKRNHIYKVYSTNETEPDPKIYVGTYSNESIVECMDTIYFHHPTGIYQLNDGGLVKISDPVKDFIDNVPSSYYTDVCGWTDGECVYFCIGDITIGDVTYSHVVLVYNVATKAWSTYSYPQDFYFASKYDDGTTLWTLIGGSSSTIYKFNYGTQDGSTPIMYSLITRPYTFDGVFSTKKHITKLAVVHDKLQGGVLTYRPDNDNSHKWIHIAQIDKDAKIINQKLDGNKIRFRIQGSSVGEPFTLTGIEILKINSELIG